MKNNTRTHTTGRSFAKLLALGLFAFASPAAVNAQSANDPVISYAGTTDNKIFFSVQYDNRTASPFTLEITDGDGYRFYGERFNQAGFRKYFALEKENLGRATITIQLASKEGVRKQTFEISNSARLVEEVNVVAK